MLTLAQQVSAIVTGLTDDQKVEAAGRFSSLKTLAPDDIVHLLAFLIQTSRVGPVSSF
jgi:hypothetical protein